MLNWAIVSAGYFIAGIAFCLSDMGGMEFMYLAVFCLAVHDIIGAIKS